MALMAWLFPAFGTQAVVVDEHVDRRDRRLFPKNKPTKEGDGRTCTGFQMPLHYPRYTKGEYERMEEWKVDALLREYGLACDGTLEEKRAFAIGAFLWPDQYN